MIDIEDASGFGQFLRHGKRDRGIGVVGSEEGEEEDGGGFSVGLVFHGSNINLNRNNMRLVWVFSPSELLV